jgi:hypothetical protein
VLALRYLCLVVTAVSIKSSIDLRVQGQYLQLPGARRAPKLEPAGFSLRQLRLELAAAPVLQIEGVDSTQ